MKMIRKVVMSEVNKHLPTLEEMRLMFAGVEIRCLDIETTGLSRAKDYVIELGMAVLNEGKIVKEGNVLFGGGESNPHALKVHGITDESRKGLPHFAEKAAHFRTVFEAPAVNDRGERIPVIYVAHNGDKFDIPFLIRKCRDAGHPIIMKDGYVWTVDTMKASKKHLSSPDYKLETLCKVYGLKHGGHRGLGDAKSCLDILCVCMKKGGFKNVLELREKLKV
jgi:DNA polymerase III epsilon subunit-like protein